MIRKATSADKLDLVAMATRFLTETPYRQFLTVSPAMLDSLVDTVLELGVVLVAERLHFPYIGPNLEPAPARRELVGMIALVELENPITGEPFADELVWWVEPEHRHGTIGPRLLVAGEAWAREKLLPVVKMVAPAGSQVGAFYQRMGYTAVETAFIKVL